MAQDQSNPTAGKTVPTKMMASARSAASSAVTMSMAIDCWLELIPYPAGSARSLWLQLETSGGKVWKRHDNPSSEIEAAILTAFGDARDQYEVRVWHDDSQEIAGLVVNSK